MDKKIEPLSTEMNADVKSYIDFLEALKELGQYFLINTTKTKTP